MNDGINFLTVVPSPYQRDLFVALARRRPARLRVYYLEGAAPDSPWPEAKLEAWEHILPGFTLGRGRSRSHFNWGLPCDLSKQLWVVNGAMTDFTTQRLMRRLGSTIPWCFWGELPSQPQGALRRWIQKVQYAPLRKARAIVAVGSIARAAYQSLVPGVPVLNQSYSCNLESFISAAATRPQRADPVFIFCGQMIERKGVDVLLQAFSALIHEKVRARLLLVGREGDLPRWLAPLPEHVRRQIDYTGFKSPDELPAIFAQADVFVLPSRHDGWGVVINQAIGSGLPIICSDAVGAGHDLVRHEENGLIVPAGDLTSLALALRRFALDPEFRRKSAAASARDAHKLSPDLSANFWSELAQKLCFSA